MPREFDIRNDLVASGPRLEPAASQLAAERVSNQLIGDHRVAVSAVDQVDGTPTTVVSSGAPVVDGDLIAAALEHVGAIAPALGLTAIAAPVTFRADPTVLETSSGAAAVNLQQTVADIGVFQAAQTVRFDHAKAIEATTGRTVTAGQVASADPDLTPEQAVSAAAEYLAVPDDGAPIRDQFGESMVQTTVDLTDFAPAVITAGDDPERHTTISAPPFADPVHVQLMWFGAGDDLRLGWEVVIGLPVGGSHFRVIVDAHDGQILYSHELTAGVAARGDVFFPDAGTNRQFRDFPLPLNSYPIPTPPGLPAPFPRTDWVTVDQSEGDNVRAHLANGGTVAGSIVNSVMTFDPTNTTGNDQLRVNLFFFCNFMHDFLYLLGFREADGNFQVGNGTAGGVGNDRVDAFVWPGAVQGTANMFTPADGTAPTMNMGLVTSTNRHTALDSSVVFHEFTHGLSNRLVGGPANAHTLDAAQSGGMGEGWSDYVACTINNTVVLGTWILNNTAGIRGFPYDSNFPDNFGMLGTGRYTEVHNNGEIWCATLMELNRRIGPPLAIQLVVDGLKLTPANPTFLQARDGIMSALVNKARAQRWSGNVRRRVEYQAWRAFARFGMGPRATSGPSTGFSGITADFTVPRGPARSGTFDGTRSVQDLVTSPWGVGVWKLAGASMTAPMLAPNGTRFGGWLLNTADNTAGPNGDFDGDGHDEILVTSPWGVGVWKLAGASMTAPMLAPNGTRFGGWLLNTKDNDVGPVGDFDGDGHDEILVTSPWGVGVWKLAGASMTAPMLAPNGTRFGGWLLNTKDNDVGPVGDFDGDGHDEILVTSPWGVGVWKLAGASMTAPMLAPNGTRFGGWLLNTKDNDVGPVGDFDGDGHDEILVTSPWGVGVWKLAGASMTAPMLAPNGTRFGGWLLNSADNSFGPVGDFDGDGHDEILVSSPWGVGIWKFTGSSFTVPMMAPNGTRFGGWLLNTADNVFGPVADYDGDGQDEIMVSSPWGVGIWKFTGSSFTVPMMAPNGTRFGGWLLNTADNNLGTGD